MRVRRKKWTDAELTTNDKVIQDNEAHVGRWKEYFNNDNPIHLEIGCGKGRFINTLAFNNLEINYIALERERHVICSAARESKNNSNNLAFLIGDVKDLEKYFAPNEISRIYINFCDPWENKRKWAKRRLTHVNFLDTYIKLLADNGEIHFKTDNKALFEFSLNQFCEKDFLLRHITFDLHNSDFADNIMTEYEEKFSSKGMNIFRLEATKRNRAGLVR